MIKKGEINTGSAVLSKSERVLEEISTIYTKEEFGLLAMSKEPYIAKQLKRKIFLPLKKVLVLIVGGHSAGKSSFVNWFYGDSIQKVSAAIETSHITFITTGRKRETFTGPATLRYFDFLNEFEQIDHLVDNLRTEMRLPLEPRSNLVTFIDTPGLIPDSNRLQFDCGEVMMKLAHYAQQILIFCDPIGQAFSPPLQEFVKEANHDYGKKMTFFLTKADSLKEDERGRIVASIAQTLSEKVSNRTIDVRPIHLPQDELAKMNRDDSKSKNQEQSDDENENDDFNQLPYLCEIIDSAVKTTIQTNLSQLGKDLGDITRIVENATVSMMSRQRGFLFSTFALLFAISYYIVSKKSRRIKDHFLILPLCVLLSIVWIIFLIIKPSKKQLNRAKTFKDLISRQTQTKLNQFYHELKEDVD